MDRPRSLTPAPRLRIIGLACLLALLLLQACSTLTLGYNRAATLSYWWLDSQLDLNEVQSQQLRTDLDTLHRWHRREALPQYAELLQRWDRLERYIHSRHRTQVLDIQALAQMISIPLL